MLIRTIEELQDMGPEQVKTLLLEKYDLEEWIVTNTREWIIFTRHGDYIMRRSEAPLNDGSVLILEGVLTAGELVMEFVSPGEGLGIFLPAGEVRYVDIGMSTEEVKEALGKPKRAKKARKMRTWFFHMCEIIFDDDLVTKIVYRPIHPISNSDALEVVGFPIDFGYSLEYRWEKYEGLQINYDNKTNLIQEILIYS